MTKCCRMVPSRGSVRDNSLKDESLRETSGYNSNAVGWHEPGIGQTVQAWDDVAGFVLFIPLA